MSEKAHTYQQSSIIHMVEENLHRREDLNCAETMLYAVDRVYGLNLPEEALRLAAGFGGGMSIESTCGVVTGGVMALSALFAGERGHHSDYTQELIREYVEGIHYRYGNLDCSSIKLQNRSPGGDCKPIMVEGAKLLHTIIERERRMMG